MVTDTTNNTYVWRARLNTYVSKFAVAIGPAVFDIRYIANDYTPDICRDSVL